jgi:hypothetical protein
MTGARFIIACVASALPILAGAVAGGSHESRPDRACIPSRIMSEWQPLDDSTILVWSGDGMHAYLLVMAAPIAGLAAAENIFIYDADRDGLICAGGTDRIATEDRPREGEPVVSIELIGDEWAARSESDSTPIPET